MPLLPPKMARQGGHRLLTKLATRASAEPMQASPAEYEEGCPQPEQLDNAETTVAMEEPIPLPIATDLVTCDMASSAATEAPVLLEPAPAAEDAATQPTEQGQASDPATCDRDRVANEDLVTVHEMWLGTPQDVPEYIDFLIDKRTRQGLVMADHLSRLGSIKTMVGESPIDVADYIAYLRDKWK